MIDPHRDLAQSALGVVPPEREADVVYLDPLPSNTALQSSNDAFATKLTPDGSIAYSTYLGGSGDDEGYGIAVDNSGNAYVTGVTRNANFPPLRASQPAYGGASDAFVAKLITTPPPAPELQLTATGSKVQGVRMVDLVWSVPNAATFHVYRNNVRIAATVQATAFTDTLGYGGTASYTYKVCVAGTATCSKDVIVRI